MVQINFAQKEIQCKIVYYGPGMSGKTTNLELVHGKVPGEARGELTSIATTGERTLYFNYMPLDLGQIAGIQTKFQLYTVPGQIYYKSTRRLVLQGVDGIVFVADSSRAKLRENKESLEDLEQNLKEMGRGMSDVPIVIQYNKRDLPDAMSVEELQSELNPHQWPHTEAVATTGDGIFPTLKMLSQMVLESVNKGGLAAAKPTAAARPVRSTAKVSAAAPAAAAAGRGAEAGQGAAGSTTAPSATATAAPPKGGAAGTMRPPSIKTSVGRPSSAPPSSALPAQPPRALGDRVVKVSGLSRAEGKSAPKTALLLGIGIAIAGLAYFLVTNL